MTFTPTPAAPAVASRPAASPSAAAAVAGASAASAPPANAARAAASPANASPSASPSASPNASPNPATTPQVCLTVLVPQAVEDRVVDWLLTHPSWQIEFSVHRVAARGPLVQLALGEEQVQGFADRIELKLIVARAQLDPLLQALLPLLTGVHGGYWVLPVERFAAFPPAP